MAGAPCLRSWVPWASLGIGVGTGLCPAPNLGQAACLPSACSTLLTFAFPWECHPFPSSWGQGRGPYPGCWSCWEEGMVGWEEVGWGSREVPWLEQQWLIPRGEGRCAGTMHRSRLPCLHLPLC